jgi:tetratricopeptide (TPR) repeat protein
MPPSPKTARPGRNDPCPCGSGRKYKACCAAAEAPFQARQAPNVGEWLERARQGVVGGRVEDAEFWYREVLTARPHDAEALAGVGQALCWRRKRREGLGYLRQAGRQLERQGTKSRDPGFLLQLSSQLQHWGEVEAGLRLAQLAARLAPESAVTQSTLALCLSRMNRTEEALPPARKAAALAPGHPGAQILLAVLEREQGQPGPARERLEQVVAEDSDPAQTARAWLELGTVLDKLKDYAGAFAAFGRAAELHASLPPAQMFDKERIFQTLARNRAGFGRDLLTRWTREDYGDGLPAPAFLFGFLRSGTTLTEQVLASHPGIVASDENDFIFELTGELARLSGVADDLPAAWRALSLEQARELRRLYWRRVEEEYGTEALGKRFVDKLALNSIDAGFIAALFPEARILFALRDPRDVCLSCYQQAFTMSPATVNLLSLDGIARQYGAVMDLWLDLRGKMAPEYLELRYEDTVNAFEATYRRIFGLLGVDFRPEVLAFHERARGRYISTPSFLAVSRPLYRTAVGRWRNYAEGLAPVLPLLEPYVRAFGYGEGEPAVRA